MLRGCAIIVTRSLSRGIVVWCNNYFFLDMECEDDELAYVVLVKGPKV